MTAWVEFPEPPPLPCYPCRTERCVECTAGPCVCEHSAGWHLVASRDADGIQTALCGTVLPPGEPVRVGPLCRACGLLAPDERERQIGAVEGRPW